MAFSINYVLDVNCFPSESWIAGLQLLLLLYLKMHGLEKILGYCCALIRAIIEVALFRVEIALFRLLYLELRLL